MTPEDTPVAVEAQVPAEGGQLLTLREAINETLKQEFRRNPNTFLWGQDVASKDKGGVFNVTKGMQQEFGPNRVFNAPIAEDLHQWARPTASRVSATTSGSCIEAAQFADYVWPAMEQIVDTSHDYYRSNGQLHRTWSCGSLRAATSAAVFITRRTSKASSVASRAFASSCRLSRTTRRGCCATPFAAAASRSSLSRNISTTRSSQRRRIPARTSRSRSARPASAAKARTSRSSLTGRPFTGRLRAANQLKDEHGIEVEVIDLRIARAARYGDDLQLGPQDLEGPGRARRQGLLGARGEIASEIQEKCFDALDGPVMRVGRPDSPVPFPKILERAVLPQVEEIYEKALELARY